MGGRLELLQGDCRDILPTLEARSVQCCVTSPPYWGLRDYGTAQWEGGKDGCDHLKPEGYRQDGGRSYVNGFHGSPNSDLAEKPYTKECGKCGARRIDSQLGLEATPEEYIAKMVAVFREVWRVLKPDATCWINLGDSYATSNPAGRRDSGNGTSRMFGEHEIAGSFGENTRRQTGLKPKDLCMMPARLAMALQADGWYLRSEIVWHKPNPMPESVTDRPTKAHEMIYLLAKAERYFYDAEAIREPQSEITLIQHRGKATANYEHRSLAGAMTRNDSDTKTLVNGDGRFKNGFYRNKRSVWTIVTQPYPDSHFATFPEEIPKLCILAGTKPGDTVLDPFAGSGTVGKVALECGRSAVLIELNPRYVALARDRTNVTAGFF